MVKHTQTIRRLLPTNFLSMFDHFVGLTHKGLVLFHFLVLVVHFVINGCITAVASFVSGCTLCVVYACRSL